MWVQHGNGTQDGGAQAPDNRELDPGFTAQPGTFERPRGLAWHEVYGLRRGILRSASEALALGAFQIARRARP